jgi:hypothetical protein
MQVSKTIAWGLGSLCALAATPALAQQAPHTLLGINCDAPPVWHCPDTECQSAVVTQQGTAVELKTRRPFFLDCPAGYKPGDKVNVLLSLHGGGSYGNWQRNYFPAMDVKDRYKLVIITPNSPTRVWTDIDDDYLHNMVDQVVGAVGKGNVEHFILAGHSQGGMTSNRIICTDYFKDKVDVRISLSGGRIGPTTPAGRGFGAGGVPVYRSGANAAAPAPFRPPPQPAGGPPGGACDYSFIFENGEFESTPAVISPLAEKYGCAARREEPEVIDPKQGYVWDSTRQDPGTDGWGHYPRSGRAKVYVFPNCRDGRVVADVVRLMKGHTEGLEPNVTAKLIELAVSAKGGKIARGAWTPPPPPPPQANPFGPPAPPPRR